VHILLQKYYYSFQDLLQHGINLWQVHIQCFGTKYDKDIIRLHRSCRKYFLVIYSINCTLLHSVYVLVPSQNITKHQCKRMVFLLCSLKRTPRHFTSLHFTTSHDTKSAVHSLHTCQCPENVARGMNILSPLCTQKAKITNAVREKRY